MVLAKGRDTFMDYEYHQYWSQLHARLKGQLRAVGNPLLSERLNQLKYASEAETMKRAVLTISNAFQKERLREISHLDLGAGTGFWTELLYGRFCPMVFK